MYYIHNFIDTRSTNSKQKYSALYILLCVWVKKKENKQTVDKIKTNSPLSSFTGTFYKTVQNNTYKHLDDHSLDLPLVNEWRNMYANHTMIESFCIKACTRIPVHIIGQT